ncbi:hypothetical protein HYX05_00730 [Candidatus Woesearchaeota archaeon]|nr:hypothetical protein [Candidatus Woesearchaeota archaeon]
MLFFKPRHKPAEIILPPPDFKEELKERPKFFDELVKKPKSETFTEEEEFNRLVRELNEGLKPLSEKSKPISEKKAATKKQKLSKKEIKKLKITTKSVQSKRLIKARPMKRAKRQKTDIAEDGLDLEDLDFGLSKELDETKLPETLEDFDVGKEFRQETKPKEILDAEEEIQSAIEKIKKREKPSILKSLFSRRREEVRERPLMPELPSAGNISTIQSKINDARQALMSFDLEAAKRSYIEVMRMYNNMASEEKAKVYHDIKELYSERKSAEELKV